jgi:streptogramin lyase
MLKEGEDSGQGIPGQPTGIDVAPNGTVWFVTSGSNQLGRIDPDTECLELFDYTRADAELEDVAVGLSNSPWVTAPGVDRVEKFDHRTKRFETIQSTGDGSAPFNVAVAGMDTPWTTAPGRGQIGYFLYGTLSLWVFFPPLYVDAEPFSIAHSQAESAQRIWITDRRNNVVVQYSREGSFLTTKTLNLGDWSNNPRGIGIDEQEQAWIAVDNAIVVWRPPYEWNAYLPTLYR